MAIAVLQGNITLENWGVRIHLQSYCCRDQSFADTPGEADQIDLPRDGNNSMIENDAAEAIVNALQKNAAL